MGTGQQSTGVSAGLAVGTLGSGDQFPGGARFLALFPFDVASKEVERIDLLRVWRDRGFNFVPIRYGWQGLRRSGAPSQG